MDLGLQGKVALITGGSGGMGRAIAHGLAAEGVSMVLAARNEAHLANGAKAVAEKHRVKVVPIAGDISRAEHVAPLVAETERAFGGIDLLINNAGTGSNETVATSTDD